MHECLTDERILTECSAVLDFLRCPTPRAWIARAIEEIDVLLLDHASLELKAAQQAQRLIWKYGLSTDTYAAERGGDFKASLMSSMSRLAREELRHFEQVLIVLEQRGRPCAAVSASGYAAGLHAGTRRREPDHLVDTLIVGAVIEARSCERFLCLQGVVGTEEPRLASLYRSLLRSEARHFEDYLSLAQIAAAGPIGDRIDYFLDRDAELIEAPDRLFRFHSGVPV
jgi:tRNA-(ms[2]io[6]A)-hydroxylase